MIAFAIPLMLTNILQLLYNAAEQIVVGRWSGPHCLAAVGATSSQNIGSTTTTGVKYNIVLKNNIKVEFIEFVEGKSTTNMINKINAK